MKEGDYITILAPMVSKLGLSGNNLIVFALIHGFSKDEEHRFCGSLDYIAKWTNLSKNSVMATLSLLTKDGFLDKEEKVINGVKFCSYKSNYSDLLRILGGGAESCTLSKKYPKRVVQNLGGGGAESWGGGAESAPNIISNIDNNIDNNINIKEDTKVSKKSAKFDFKAELIALGVEEDIARDWLLVRKAKKATNSETAFNILKKQFSISGISPNECIKICIDRNWMGFKAEWVSNLNKGNNQQNQTTKGNSNDKVKKLLNKNVHVIDSEGTLSDGTYLKNNYRYYFSKREGRAASIMLSAPPMPSDDMEFDSISGQWYIPREIRDNEKITDMLW